MGAQITLFNKNNATATVQEIVAVLNAHFADRNLIFTNDAGTYSPQSVRVKVTATVKVTDTGEAALTPQQAEYQKLRIMYTDLPEIGWSFTYNSNKYTIVGAKLRSHKYPILCTREGATLLTKFTLSTIRHKSGLYNVK